MTEARAPDLLVGVDFGMTCTGVSYANLIRSKTAVRTIMNWPGHMNSNENKVPTVLSYSRSTQQLSKWGFDAEGPLERENPDREHVDWFKVLLDESQYKQMKAYDSSHTMPESLDVVEKWFIDYLSALYKHIEYKLAPELPLGKTWSTALIEFIFSVPTTWQPQPTVERFRSICAKSGFTQYRTHSIQIGLTEAEAAAVHTSSEAAGLFRVGEIMLVCDIGGGTTDLSVLRIKESTENNFRLEQMDVVQGRTIGSAKIDEAFQRLALQKLTAAQASVPFKKDPAEIAWRMMKSRDFQNAKCGFGALDDSPIFAVPGLDVNYNNEQLHVYNGSVHFGKSDMQALFDTQISGLYEMIDKQISRFQVAYPGQAIAHLVLSGGLGNSKYVQDRLIARYSAGQPNFTPIKVHLAPEPQLAVCKGILVDRLAILNSGIGVLPWRCARASYGLVYKMKYDPKNLDHKGVTTVADPFTAQPYIAGCVDWLIKKGQPVNSSTPIVSHFTHKLEPGADSKRSFPCSIVISHADAANLPSRLGLDAHKVAEVTSDLSLVPETKFKLKNRHWWNTGKKYRRCEYDVRVVIGAADIIFELWFQNSKLSKDTPMPVEWMDTPAPPVGFDAEQNLPELPAMSHSRKVGKSTPSRTTVPAPAPAPAPTFPSPELLSAMTSTVTLVPDSRPYVSSHGTPHVNPITYVGQQQASHYLHAPIGTSHGQYHPGTLSQPQYAQAAPPAAHYAQAAPQYQHPSIPELPSSPNMIQPQLSQGYYNNNPAMYTRQPGTNDHGLQYSGVVHELPTTQTPAPTMTGKFQHLQIGTRPMSMPSDADGP